jgi:hypothetical protein
MLVMQDVVESAIDAPNSAANTEAAIRQTSSSLLSFIVPLMTCINPIAFAVLLCCMWEQMKMLPMTSSWAVSSLSLLSARSKPVEFCGLYASRSLGSSIR